VIAGDQLVKQPAIGLFATPMVYCSRYRRGAASICFHDVSCLSGKRPNEALD
jgi:hypothetical protein